MCGQIKSYCCSMKYYAVDFYLVISALIPTREYLTNVSDIVLSPSNNSFPKFGDMAPSYRIPSAILLKMIDREGIIYVRTQCF